MVSIAALWLPIVVAAALVFVASSVLHMMLKYHRADYGQVKGEDRVMDALRPFAIPPGDYALPCPGMGSPQDPEFVARFNKGPVVFMTVLPAGQMAMGAQLAGWFVYCLVVSLFAAYLTSRALPPGVAYLEAFRFAGTVAFVGYALALWQHSIWYKRSWMTTVRANIDGLIYALLTGGVFGWLWPA